MGNHDVGQAFAAAADLFWCVIPEGTTPSKELTLKALEAVGERFRGSDAEFDDEMADHTTPLGRMVAIAFDATPEEMTDEESDGEYGEAWYNGPLSRFSAYFELC
jgi:hypothetical protein